MHCAVAEELKPFAGKIMDTDSHEMLPIQSWTEAFGPEMVPVVDWISRDWLSPELGVGSATTISRGKSDKDDLNHPNYPGFEGDIMPIDADVVNVKGSRAPGAVDPRRRLEMMDATGIQRQLIFPGVAGKLSRLALYDREFRPEISDRIKLEMALLEPVEDWTVRCASLSERLRPVVYLPAAQTVDALHDHIERLITRGIRAFHFRPSILPGGVSPAHSSMDRVWELIARTNSTASVHIDGEGHLFFGTTQWRNAEAFEGYGDFGEFALNPWSTSTLHLPAQNFLATMVMGGVMERHPSLRFSVIEFGAIWVGQLMELLDSWYVSTKIRRSDLPELPSTYIKRNVRVSPLSFEDPGHLMGRYEMEDILCFATDYPHLEGGKNIAKKFYDQVKPLGDVALQKFFVTNGEFLLPD